MKYKGDTLTVTITIPLNESHQIEKLFPLHVDGYPLDVETNTVPRRKKRASADGIPRVDKINFIREVAFKLDVLKKIQDRDVVVRRTCLVYHLKDYFSGPIIADAFGWDPSTVVSCRSRYEDLKDYLDYKIATEEVTQLLKQYPLEKFRP